MNNQNSSGGADSAAAPSSSSSLSTDEPAARRRRRPCSLFATSAGCQLLVDRIVVYCTVIDIVRIGQCTRLLHLACEQPRVWRSLLATEWSVDVAQLEQLHRRSLERSRKFHVPSSVHEVVLLNEEHDAEEEEEEGQEGLEKQRHDDEYTEVGGVVEMAALHHTTSTPRNNNSNDDGYDDDDDESPLQLPMMLLSSSPWAAITPPRRITDRRRLPLSPAGSPPRLLDSATRSNTNTPARTISTPSSAATAAVAAAATATSSPPSTAAMLSQGSVHPSPSAFVSRSSLSSLSSPPPPSPGNSKKSKSPISPKLLRCPPEYCWKSLLKYIHKRRVTNWQLFLDQLFENVLAESFATQFWQQQQQEQEQEQHQLTSGSSSSDRRGIVRGETKQRNFSIDWSFIRASLMGFDVCERRHRLACSTLSSISDRDAGSSGANSSFNHNWTLLNSILSSRPSLDVVSAADPAAVVRIFQDMSCFELESKIAAMDNVVEAQLQSGVARGQVHHRHWLASDLILMAQMQLVLARRHHAAAAVQAHAQTQGMTTTTTATTTTMRGIVVGRDEPSATLDVPLAIFPGRDIFRRRSEAGNNSSSSQRQQQQQRVPYHSLLTRRPVPPSPPSSSSLSLSSPTSRRSPGLPPPLPLLLHRSDDNPRNNSNNNSASDGRRYVALLDDDDGDDDGSRYRSSTTTNRNRLFLSGLSTSTASSSSSSSSLSSFFQEDSDDENNDERNDGEEREGGNENNEEKRPSSSSSPLLLSLTLDAVVLDTIAPAKELTQRALGDLATALLLLEPKRTTENNSNNNSNRTVSPDDLNKNNNDGNSNTASSSSSKEDTLWTAAQTLATQCTSALGSFPFSGATFDVDSAYDQVQVNGTLKERAAFLFRCEFWRGPTFMLKMYQYSVCDCLKLWPERLMREAHACSTTDAERLCSDGWRFFDRQDIEGAQRTIELAASLVVACKCHNRQHMAAMMTMKRSNSSSSSSSAPTSPTTTSTTAAPLPPQFSSSSPPSAFSPARINVRVPSQVYVPVIGGYLPVHSPSPFSEEEGSAHASPDRNCSRCSKPIVLPPSLSFVCSSSGFILQQSADAIDMYITSLRGCNEPGRRAITCNNIGSIYSHFKEFAAAAQWHEASIACNRNYFLPYKNLARCHNAMNDATRALQTIVDAIAVCRPLPAEAFAERSKYASSAMQHEMDISMRVCPRLSYPYRLNAALMMDAGMYESALSMLSEIIDTKLDPSDLSLRAVFHRDARRLDKSVEDMRLALTMDPGNLTFLKWLEKHAPSAADYVKYDF